MGSFREGHSNGHSARAQRGSYKTPPFTAVTSSHADVWSCSKCSTDRSNLLRAVIAFDNCCDPVARTAIHIRQQLRISPVADAGRHDYPGDRPGSTLCPTLLNRPTGTEFHLPSAFL